MREQHAELPRLLIPGQPVIYRFAITCCGKLYPAQVGNAVGAGHPHPKLVAQGAFQQVYGLLLPIRQGAEAAHGGHLIFGPAIIVPWTLGHAHTNNASVPTSTRSTEKVQLYDRGRA